MLYCKIIFLIVYELMDFLEELDWEWVEMTTSKCFNLGHFWQGPPAAARLCCWSAEAAAWLEGAPHRKAAPTRENRLQQGKNIGFNTKSNKNDGFEYKMNRNGMGMDGEWMGIHAPPTLSSEKPFSDFALWIFDHFQTKKTRNVIWSRMVVFRAPSLC